MAIREKVPVESDEQKHKVLTLDLSDGELLEIPGARGRLGVSRFDSGLILYRGEFEVYDDCTLAVSPSLSEPWLGVSMHIVGESLVHLPNGTKFQRRPLEAVIDRFDMTGTSYQLKGGQVIRHVAAVMPLKPLLKRLDHDYVNKLDSFVDMDQEVCKAEPIPTTNRLRSLASRLFYPLAEGPARQIRLEGLANLYFSEGVDCFAQRDGKASVDEAIDWEKAGLDNIFERIHNELHSPLSVAQLAISVGMAESRLNQLFIRETGLRCSDYIRRERMNTAQRMLGHGGNTVKEVAASVGYSHVSNFTRAYRDTFGETPSRALRRAPGT